MLVNSMLNKATILSAGVLALLVIGALVRANRNWPVLSGRVIVDGSGSAHRLVWLVGDTFMKKHEQALVSVGISGSKSGLERLVEGSVDVALISMPLEGVDAKERPKESEVVEKDIAQDHVTILVTSSCPAKELTIEELKDLLTVPQESAVIHRLLPHPKSGTRIFLARKLEMDSADFVHEEEAKNMLNTIKELEGSTSEDGKEHGIGMISSSQLSMIGDYPVRPIAIVQQPGGPDLSPTLFARNLTMVTLKSNLDRNDVARYFFEDFGRYRKAGELEFGDLGLTKPIRRKSGGSQ